MSGAVRPGVTENANSAAVKKKSGFMRRELPTIIAIVGLLVLWLGLVHGGG